MYLRKLHVKNLKRLGHFTLEFTNPDGTPRMWTVLIGENGTAKTSILQAIGLLAAGQRAADALADNPKLTPYLRDLRAAPGDGSLYMEAEFEFTPHAQEYLPSHLIEGERYNFDLLPRPLRLTSELTLRPGAKALQGTSAYVGSEVGRERSGMDPLTMARDYDARHRFVAAYGIARALPPPNKQPPPNQWSKERLRSLFDPSTELTATNFIEHFKDPPGRLIEDSFGRIPAAADQVPQDKAAQFERVLQKALLQIEDLLPEVRGIELQGRGGLAHDNTPLEGNRIRQRLGPQEMMIPVTALSHGYQSTIAWIADLIGHILLESETELDTTMMEGLVLIDELDLYLHPKWQRTLVTALREIFPKIQFVATTHSPLILSGLRPEEIVLLKVDEADGNVKRFAPDRNSGELRPVPVGDVSAYADPRLLTSSEMIQEYFGLPLGVLNPEGEALRELSLLRGAPQRTPFQERRLAELERQVGPLLPRPTLGTSEA